MARTALGRVFAVFFVSVVMAALVFAFFAWPVKLANAQAAIQCAIAHGTVDELRDAAGEAGYGFVELNPFGADLYIASVSTTRPSGSEGLRAVITVAPNGAAVLSMVQGGVLCIPHLRVTPASHSRAIGEAA
jgi:hypothetical protein